MSTERHSEELLLALNGRVGEIVVVSHDGHNRDKSSRGVKNELPLRLGNLLLLYWLLGCWLRRLRIE